MSISLQWFYIFKLFALQKLQIITSVKIILAEIALALSPKIQFQV